MPAPLKLSKADVRRAMVRYHFTRLDTHLEAFERLRSVQFDPIAPVGCNHDLVLQARLPNYKVGDWHRTAYEDRLIYDGWDKCASLIPFEGWPVRRIFHTVHRRWFDKRIFEDHPHAVDAVIKEITERGPLMPKEFEFQQRKDDWKGSWFGASLTKQTLKALWHSGIIMTSGRSKGQHLYDLTERVVPPHLFNTPRVDDTEAIRELVLERHRAMGIVRPSAPPEVWSYEVLRDFRKAAMTELVHQGSIVPVAVEGVNTHATPTFLSLLDQPPMEPRVVFVAPLDPFMWDRKMIAHLFDFDYIWEIYVKEEKRKWGYYVLPVLFGDKLVARAEFWCREGVLELREWHNESVELSRPFWDALEKSTRLFMQYCSANRTIARDHIDPKVRDLFSSV